MFGSYKLSGTITGRDQHSLYLIKSDYLDHTSQK